MTDRADDNPEGWADRRERGDGETARGTSGAEAGTSGVWPPFRAWALAIALRVLVTYVNVTTILDDAHRRGEHVPLALPITLELTSGVASIFAAVAVAVALKVAPPGRAPLWRTLTVHLGGTLVFSAVHVGLMTLMRIAIFATAGKVYGWSPGELPYEYRKDFLTYILIAGIFWLLSRPRQAALLVAQTGPSPSFDIRDGASILRVPVGEIVAARAAGNYVEFALEDGRRPLMRAALGSVEAQLAAQGFVRTHRSWLVNAARVRALTPAGSGDFRLDLGCGVTAPLSRRYPEALARLRGDEPGAQRSA
jgi:hypothetical protein